MTTKIFNQRNNNILKRIVLDIKSKKPLDFNPRANPHNPIFQLPLVEKVEANGKLICITKFSALCYQKKNIDSRVSTTKT